MTTLKAGIDRAIITPKPGMYLVGYEDRMGGAEKVHDDLTATILMLKDNSETLVIVSLDLLGLNREIVDEIRHGITARLQIPEKNILLCCSHTHSGPVGWAPSSFSFLDDMREFLNRLLYLPAGLVRLKEKGLAFLPKAFKQPRGARFNRAYLKDLVRAVINSAVTASAGLTDIEIFHAAGTVDIGINRRERMPDGTIELGHYKDGPVDPELHVLEFKSGDTLLGTLVNFTCHPAILGPNSNVISAEMIGVMRNRVEKQIGGRCMFIQGACGNINPDVAWSDDNLPDIRQFGERAAQAVLDAIPKARKINSLPIKVTEDVVDAYLDVREDMKHQPVEKIYKLMLNHFFQAPMVIIDPYLNICFPWKTVVKKDGEGFTTPIHLSSVRLGDVAIATASMESFVETGCAVKQASPAPVTLFAAYTNGLSGYLPTAEEQKLGGYEAEGNPYVYRLPGTFRLDTESRVVAKLKTMLEKVTAP